MKVISFVLFLCKIKTIVRPSQFAVHRHVYVQAKIQFIDLFGFRLQLSLSVPLHTHRSGTFCYWL